MIEQYLQIALEFLKEVWFQLDSQFGLEETEAFKLLKPYLLQLQDNPTYLGITFAALILIPFGLYKVRSNARERDRKLDELMEEMEEEEEEEFDEDDPRRLRRPEPAEGEITGLDDDDDEDIEEDIPLFDKGEEEPPPYMQILEKLDEEEKEDELHVDTQKVMGEEGEEFELEPISSELAEPDINKDLSEFEGFDFDSEVSEDASHDQAIEELQKEGELMELEDEVLAPDDPFANYSELDDEEQDLAIQKLQDEMESTINKLTEQLESEPETTSTMKDLGDIRIGDDATIDDEYTLDEDVSLDEMIEESAPPELNDPIPEPEPEAPPLESLDITPVIEKVELEEPKPLQPVPERDYSIDDKPGREADSLINRLKYFQENLDTRLHHGEKEDSSPHPEHKINDLAADSRFVDQRNFAPKSPKVTPEDNKKYMEVLESFIFLKDQNKH